MIKFALYGMLLVTSGVYCRAQFVDQWKNVAPGRFTGSTLLETLSGSYPYVAAISSTLGFDSSNVLLLSDDAGETWRVALATYCYPFKPGIGWLDTWWKQQHFQSVVRLSKDTILVYGGRRPKDDPEYGLIGTLYPTLWRTTDGGATWTERDVIEGTRRVHHENVITATAGNKLYLIALDTLGQNRRLYSSQNAGASWTEHKSEAFGLPLCAPAVYSENVVAVLEPNVMRVSENGGASFVQRVVPKGPIDLCVVNDSTFVVGSVDDGKSRISLSTDRGASWSTILEDSRPDELRSVSVNSHGDLIALFNSHTSTMLKGSSQWSDLPLPYGSDAQSSADVLWISSDRALATTGTNIVLRTGKKVPATPTLQAFRLGYTSYLFAWDRPTDEFTSTFQIALRPSDGLLAVDYEIFDTVPLLYKDTVLVANSAGPYSFPLGTDVHARVRNVDGMDTSGWSYPIVLRMPTEPDPVALSEPQMSSPQFGAHLAGSIVEFEWFGDPRTETWDLYVTDRTPGPGAWDDSVAIVIKGLQLRSHSLDIPKAGTYHWTVVAHAPGLKSAGGNVYRTFHVGTVSVADAWHEHRPDELSVYDTLGRRLLISNIDLIPPGCWFVRSVNALGIMRTTAICR